MDLEHLLCLVPERRGPWLSPLNQRRWRNFRRNSRAFWSLVIFGVSTVLYAQMLLRLRAALRRGEP